MASRRRETASRGDTAPSERRPLVARIAAKQKTAGGTARDAVREASAFLEEKE